MSPIKFGCSLCLSLLLLSASVFGQGSVTLDHVDGLSGGKLSVGADVVFHFRLTNNSGFNIYGATNGFRIYSPDGAEWQAVAPDTSSLGWGAIFDGGLFFTSRSVSGNGSDTVGFGGFRIEQPGIAPGFDQVAYKVRTSVASDFNGQTLCVDSCYYPPTGYWFWSHGDNGNTVPTWDGPHCFEISGCCQLRADIDHSGAGPDIADLIYLVTFMFQQGPEPPCFEPGGGEADIDGNGAGPDIADLVYLVQYMFQQGPDPVPCP